MNADPSVPVNQPGVTSPFGMLRYAEEYRRAAELVKKAQPAGSASSPALMLIGQSIELSLKAFLLARGVPLQDLRVKPYGHDLEALLMEAQARRLDRIVPLHGFQTGAINLISPLYRKHEFRYIVTGIRQLPKWGFLALAAADLTRCQHDWLLRRRVGKVAALKRIALKGQF